MHRGVQHCASFDHFPFVSSEISDRIPTEFKIQIGIKRENRLWKTSSRCSILLVKDHFWNLEIELERLKEIRIK